MSNQKDDNDDNGGGSKSRPFTAYDVQKVRLDKLFANIDKPVEIPNRKDEKKFAIAPEFVRNVMGSSAGAGSGEFHVYRHLRRKEYARLHYIETHARNEQLDEDFHKKIEENRKKAEDATDKKRAKRQKKKQKQKAKKVKTDDIQDNPAKQSDNAEEDARQSNEESDQEQAN